MRKVSTDNRDSTDYIILDRDPSKQGISMLIICIPYSETVLHLYLETHGYEISGQLTGFTLDMQLCHRINYNIILIFSRTQTQRK